MTTTTPQFPRRAPTGSTTNTGVTGNTGLAQLADNFNSFLTLLTTQLQNQDPLDPLDTNQFTQQLVEFTSVQQQVDMNTNMQTLISLQQTSEATSAMQFLGSSVTLNGTTATLAAGVAGDLVLELAVAGDRQCHDHELDRPDGLSPEPYRSMPAPRPIAGTAKAIMA